MLFEIKQISHIHVWRNQIDDDDDSIEHETLPLTADN